MYYLKKYLKLFLLTFSTDDFVQGKVGASVKFSVTFKKFMYFYLVLEMFEVVSVSSVTMNSVIVLGQL